MRTKWTPIRLREVEEAYPLVGIRISYKRKVRRGGKKVRRIRRNGKLVNRWVVSGGKLVNKYAPAYASLLDAVCRLPKADTIYGLYMNLHERAHLILRHFNPEDAPDARLREMYTGNGFLNEAEQEFQAEQWAITTMERHGVPVPKKVRDDARRYIQECAVLDVKRGDGKPAKHIRRWARCR